MREVVKRLARIPFLVFGMGTVALFYLMELLPGSAQVLLAPALRVLIVPAWAGWDVGTVLTYPLRTAASSSPIASAVLSGLVLVIGFMPYALADALLAISRRRRVAGA